MKTIVSNKSPYELVRLNQNRIYDESELKKICKIKDRYHIVGYRGKIIATAKTLQAAIVTVNIVNGWGADCVIDTKNLIAYDLVYSKWGAGHGYCAGLKSRY